MMRIKLYDNMTYSIVLKHTRHSISDDVKNSVKKEFLKFTETHFIKHCLINVFVLSEINIMLLILNLVT